MSINLTSFQWPVSDRHEVAISLPHKQKATSESSESSSSENHWKIKVIDTQQNKEVTQKYVTIHLAGCYRLYHSNQETEKGSLLYNPQTKEVIYIQVKFINNEPKLYVCQKNRLFKDEKEELQSPYHITKIPSVNLSEGGRTSLHFEKAKEIGPEILNAEEGTIRIFTNELLQIIVKVIQVWPKNSGNEQDVQFLHQQIFNKKEKMLVQQGIYINHVNAITGFSKITEYLLSPPASSESILGILADLKSSKPSMELTEKGNISKEVPDETFHPLPLPSVSPADPNSTLISSSSSESKPCLQAGTVPSFRKRNAKEKPNFFTQLNWTTSTGYLVEVSPSTEEGVFQNPLKKHWKVSLIDNQNDPNQPKTLDIKDVENINLAANHCFYKDSRKEEDPRSFGEGRALVDPDSKIVTYISVVTDRALFKPQLYVRQENFPEEHLSHRITNIPFINKMTIAKSRVIFHLAWERTREIDERILNAEEGMTRKTISTKKEITSVTVIKVWSKENSGHELDLHLCYEQKAQMNKEAKTPIEESFYLQSVNPMTGFSTRHDYAFLLPPPPFALTSVIKTIDFLKTCNFLLDESANKILFFHISNQKDTEIPKHPLSRVDAFSSNHRDHFTSAPTSYEYSPFQTSNPIMEDDKPSNFEDVELPTITPIDSESEDSYSLDLFRN